MKGKSVIGESIPRLESADKVTGKLTYLDDLKIRGMLHAKLLRSPLPHARIQFIDARRARRHPGVTEVLTRDELAGSAGFESRYGPVLQDQCVVATDKVRYVGDIVAAVAAEDAEAAEEALELIQVEYAELPAVYDPEEALGEGAPILHEVFHLPEEGVPDMEVDARGGTNLCNQVHVERGDVEAAFAECDHVFEDLFTSPATQHVTLETLAAAARFEGDGRLTVWSTVQNPFMIRRQMAEMFHLPVSRVRVISLALGGGYGSKMYVKLEPVVAALAYLCRRPVGITLTREETFQTISKHAARIYVKTGVKKDGTLLARQCRIFLNTGAYAEIGPRVAQKSAIGAAGPYQIPHLLIDAYLCYTNCTPAGAFRGFGLSQAAWGYESHMDMVARALRMDPLEFRRRNLLDEGDRYVTGERMRNFAARQALEKAALAIEWDEKPKSSGSKARGKGLACIIKGTLTPSISAASIRLNEDGSLTLSVGTVDMGQASDTVLAQIASQELAVPMDQIAILHSDTDYNLYDFITASSRSTFHMGQAVQAAARDIKQQLACLAAPLLEVAPDDVVFENQCVVSQAGGEAKTMTYRALLMRHFGIKGANLVGEGVIKTSKVDARGQPSFSAFWVAAAGAAEVEVDRETGRVCLLRYITATDIGRALNPQSCLQQVRGAAIMGIGQALLEEMAYRDGLPVNPNLLDYNLPRFLDIPGRVEAILIEDPNPRGPYGAKGIGGHRQRGGRRGGSADHGFAVELGKDSGGSSAADSERCLNCSEGLKSPASALPFAPSAVHLFANPGFTPPGSYRLAFQRPPF